jgi:hypothetical protein
MNKAAVGVLALAALALVGCSTAGSAAPRPSPAASHDSAAAAATRAAVVECSRFRRVYNEIQQATQNDTTTGQLAAALSLGSTRWGQELRTAASPASALPAGRNHARGLAIAIDQANVDLGNTSLMLSLGKYRQAARQWQQTTGALSAALQDCPAP